MSRKYLPVNSGNVNGGSARFNSPKIKTYIGKGGVPALKCSAEMKKLYINGICDDLKCGLYSFEQCCERQGLQADYVLQWMAKDANMRLCIADAEEEGKKYKPSVLVAEAIKSLSDLVNGNFKQKKQKFVRSDKGQMVKVEETIETVIPNAQLINKVLSSFTAAFSDGISPEVITRIMMSMNKFIMDKYNDYECLEKIMVYQKEFIEEVILTSGNIAK